MPRHSETRMLPYSQEQLFDLVAAVERYPEFLPWCKAARVIERRSVGLTADLVIGYKMFTENFRSEVVLDRPRAITVKYLSGPLTHLTNQWQFSPIGKKSCELSFQVDFDFQSPLLKTAMELFFDKALSKMVSAFEERAQQIYDPKKRAR